MRCHIKVAGISIFILISEREDFIKKERVHLSSISAGGL